MERRPTRGTWGTRAARPRRSAACRSAAHRRVASVGASRRAGTMAPVRQSAQLLAAADAHDASRTAASPCHRGSCADSGRGSAAVLEAPSSLVRIPRKPFVANTPTDAIARAARGHGEAITQRIVDELQTLIHRNSLQPWHRTSSGERQRRRSLEGVLPNVPGLLCYRCTRSVPGRCITSVAADMARRCAV